MSSLESPEWQPPDSSPDEIIRGYSKLVRSIPGVKVWARIDGARVHFITAVPDMRESERAAYSAELELMDIYGSDVVSFDLYRASLPPEEASAEAHLVLSST